MSVCDATCPGPLGPAPFVASAQHNIISAILPEGWGGSLPVVVTVEGQSSDAAAATYTYAPPQVFGISPPSGPTSGLMSDGITPINMTVRMYP